MTLPADDLDLERNPPHRVPRRPAPHAGTRRGPVQHRRQGRRRRLRRGDARRVRWPAGSPSSPTTRPRRCSSAGSTSTPRRRTTPTAATTSGAGTSPTTPASRWCSTGGRRSPGRSTAPARATRRASRVRRRFGFADGAADQLRGRAPRPRRGARHRQPDPDRRDRAARASGPMRDIVATIQPEQDELVRADLDDSICVQGAPGTGKTAVGLHRAAYLLYLHRERLRRSGVLVVGPNRAFLSLHLGGAAGPRRDRGRAVHGRGPDRPLPGRGRPTPAEAARGQARRPDGGGAGRPRSARTSPGRPSRSWCSDGSYRWRIGAEALRRHRRRRAARGTAVRHRPRAGPRPRGRRCCSASPRRAAATRPASRGCAGWGKRQPVMEFLDAGLARGDAGGSRRTACSSDPPAGVLTDERARADPLARPRPHAQGGHAGRAADLVLIDEAAGLIERMPSFGHVVRRRGAGPVAHAVPGHRAAQRARLDHAARRPRAGHRAVGGHRLGGDACATSASPTRPVVPLTIGFRVPAAVVAFANRLLPALGVDVPAGRVAAPRRRARPYDQVSDVDAATVAEVRAALDLRGLGRRDRRGRRRAAIARRRWPPPASRPRPPTTSRPRSGSRVVPASVVKGLEYDHVVVVEPAADRRGRAARPAPALRGADPGGVAADGHPHRATARATAHQLSLATRPSSPEA